jgi:hypothetical protein
MTKSRRGLEKTQDTINMTGKRPREEEESQTPNSTQEDTKTRLQLNVKGRRK